GKVRPDPRPAPLGLPLPRRRGDAPLLRGPARPAAYAFHPPGRVRRHQRRAGREVRAHLLRDGRRQLARVLRPGRRYRRRALAQHAALVQPHGARGGVARAPREGAQAPASGRRRGRGTARPRRLGEVDLLLRPERRAPRAHHRHRRAPRGRLPRQCARRARCLDAREAHQGKTRGVRLRSVDLEIPDVGQAGDFLSGVWGLFAAGKSKDTQFFRGTGSHPYILSITKASSPAVSAITFSGGTEEVEAVGQRNGMKNLVSYDVPGGGKGLEIRGPEAQTYRFIIESSPPAPLPAERDKPIQLSHAVLNSADQEASERFAVEKLGFAVSDRTAHMRFVRCNRKHHCVAYAKSASPSLNHIAFEMKDVDAVMRGITRMREAGYESVWGPGRHGP